MWRVVLPARLYPDPEGPTQGSPHQKPGQAPRLGMVSFSWGPGKAQWPQEEGAEALGWGLGTQPPHATQPQKEAD